MEEQLYSGFGLYYKEVFYEEDVIFYFGDTCFDGVIL